MNIKKIPFKSNKSKIDSKGYIINEASKNKVQKDFLPILKELKCVYKKKFKDRLYGISIRGSVAVGKAIKNISDFDGVIIVKNKLNKEDKLWNAQTIIKLNQKFDYFSTIDITLLSKKDLLKSNYYKNLRVYLKTSSFCLYGKNATKYIKKIRADKQLALYLFSDIVDELKKIRNRICNKNSDKTYLGIKRSNKFWCRWAMRITLRSALGLVMIRRPIYSKNTKTCYLEFAKDFPEYNKLMKKIFQWELNPMSNRKRIVNFLDTFIPFYKELWEQQLNKSNFSLDIYKKIGIEGTYKIGFDYLKKLIGDISNKKILDYGCGNGRSSVFLRDLNGEVYGVDISKKAINLVKKYFKNSRRNFRLMTKNQIPFTENYFDFVFCSFVHPGIEDMNKMTKIHKEIKRVLKKNGSLFILTINPGMWGHDYKSCSSNFPKNFNYKSGDKINVVLKTKPQMEFQDYYWTEKDYENSLKSAGFKKIKIILTVNNSEKVKIPPYLIIKTD